MKWDWKVLVGVVVAAAAAGWFFTRTVHEPDIDFAVIDRDLSDLSVALRADDIGDVELIPKFSTGIRFPTTIQYRRASAFWPPVVGSVGRVGRAGRTGRPGRKGQR
jgi:hypothetical protein